MFSDVYRGRRVLLTGHTGFKGSWLALWLQALGAEVTGVALAPESTPSHWGLLELGIRSHETDIRDHAALRDIVADVQPEFVFHLAAQALVRRSYQDPLQTWSTNVMGTANLLDACRAVTCLVGIVVVTTDKCYDNQEWPWGYREIDRLGGHDPYSASKAGTELVAASYRSSYFHALGAPLLATARAGNVIGGGDWARDRLIPDLVRAIAAREPLQIRSPDATRPWQHVLDSLSGYLTLGQRLLQGETAMADAWNFGPGPEANQTVSAVLDKLASSWPELAWERAVTPQPHEATLLYLDSSKARAQLNWRPVWTLEQALAATADWYRDDAVPAPQRSRAQLDRYEGDARVAGLDWAGP